MGLLPDASDGFSRLANFHVLLLLWLPVTLFWYYLKIVWLWLLVENAGWSWTYLGFYDDFYFHDDTRTVHDRSGRAIWTFTSEKSGDEAKDDTCTPYSPIFLPWRNIAVRLSYVHLIDNTIHVIWFRYFINESTIYGVCQQL
jgi:hypothetical protein